jgi:hypothetical protein
MPIFFLSSELFYFLIDIKKLPKPYIKYLINILELLNSNNRNMRFAGVFSFKELVKRTNISITTLRTCLKILEEQSVLVLSKEYNRSDVIHVIISSELHTFFIQQ